MMMMMMGDDVGKENNNDWYEVGKRGKAKLAFQWDSDGTTGGELGAAQNGIGKNGSLSEENEGVACDVAVEEESNKRLLNGKVTKKRGGGGDDVVPTKTKQTTSSLSDGIDAGRNVCLKKDVISLERKTYTKQSQGEINVKEVFENENDAERDDQDIVPEMRREGSLSTSTNGHVEHEKYRYRYQKYLVDELRRVIDELYLVLELDYNVEDVSRAYQILQASAHDFSNLVRRGELQEIVAEEITGRKKDGKDNGRPHSIAWEVRRTKASPKHMKLLEELSNNGYHSNTPVNQISEAVTSSSRSGNIRDSSTSPKKDLLPSLTLDEITPTVLSTESHKSNESTPISMSARRRLNIDYLCNTKTNNVPSSPSQHTHSGVSSKDNSPGDAGSINDTFSFDHGRGARGDNRSTADNSNHGTMSSNSNLTYNESQTQLAQFSPTSRALSIQAKLMSPERNRKRTPLETKQRAEMKQARAEAAREEHKEALATRLARVADERQAKQIQLADKREKLEQELESKHQRSKELRESHIQTIQQRASEENQKVSEVQFISQLAQENRKLSLQQKLEDSEARRNEHLDSIRKKQKGAETAAEEAEARRRAAYMRREQQKAEAEEKRRLLRKQKAEAQRFLDQAYKDNMNRMSKSRKARQQATGHYFDASSTEHAVRERLQRATTRRREFVAQISNSACLSDSRPKMCRSAIDGVLSPSRKEKEHSDVSGNSAIASCDDNDEHDHSLKGQQWKNRTKKIRRRLSAMAFEPEEANTVISDDIKSIVHYPMKKLKHSMNWIQRQMKSETGNEGRLDTLFHVRRAELFLGEAKKVFDSGNEAEKHAARLTGFLRALIEVLQMLPPSSTVLTASLGKLVAQLLQLPANAEYTLCTNITIPLVQVLCSRLCGFDGSGDGIQDIRHATPLDPESVALEGLLLLFAEVLRAPCDTEQSLRMHENLLEYLVTFGAIHRLRDFVAFYERQADVGSTPIPGCIVAALYLLTSMVTRKSRVTVPVHKQPPLTSSQYTVLSSFKHTVISGLVSILTETVLLACPRSTSPANYLPTNFAEVSLKLFYFLNSIGRLNLEFLQDMMGSPDMRVEAYHLVSFLLSYSTREWKHQPARRGLLQSMLNELLLFIGYFCLLRPRNQDVLHWGSHPTILQKLCDLPFDYFCKPKLLDALMPTLLIACYNHEGNLVVVREQLNVKHILAHMDCCADEKIGKSNDIFSIYERFPEDKFDLARSSLLQTFVTKTHK